MARVVTLACEKQSPTQCSSTKNNAWARDMQHQRSQALRHSKVYETALLLWSASPELALRLS